MRQQRVVNSDKFSFTPSQPERNGLFDGFLINHETSNEQHLKFHRDTVFAQPDFLNEKELEVVMQMIETGKM